MNLNQHQELLLIQQIPQDDNFYKYCITMNGILSEREGQYLIVPLHGRRHRQGLRLTIMDAKSHNILMPVQQGFPQHHCTVAWCTYRYE
jgi:hypothetical protein